MSTPTISVKNTSVDYGSTVNLGASADSGGSLTYSSSSASIATVDTSGNVKGVKPGTATITINVASTTYYNSGSTTVTFTVNKATPTISVSNTSYTKNHGDEYFSLDASISPTTNAPSLSYSSSDDEIVSVTSAGIVRRFNNAGTATITISASGNDYYNAPESKTVTVTVKSVAPESPTLTADSGLDNKVLLKWTPNDNGGKSISQYVIYRGLDETNLEEFKSFSGSTTSYSDSDVTNGTTYYYKIAAYNGDYYSAWADMAAVSAKPYRAPDAPQNLTAKATAKGEITLAWSKPEYDGGDDITEYAVKAYTDAAHTTEAEGLTISQNEDGTLGALVTDCTLGDTYYFTVQAQNNAGLGTAATADAQSWNTPDAPKNVTAEPTKLNTITVSWEAPDDNGGTDVTSYIVMYRPEGSDATWSTKTGVTDTATDIGGLTTGTRYEFKVKAVNSVDANGGAESGLAAAICAWVPSAPKVGAVHSGNERFVFDSIENTENGGVEVLSYNIYYSVKGTEKWSLLNNLPVDEGTEDIKNAVVKAAAGEKLENGVEYDLKVTALNKMGEGAESEIVSVTSGLPGKVVNLEVTPMSGQVMDITFDAAEDNGSEVLYYSIYIDGVKQDLTFTTLEGGLAQISPTHYTYTAMGSLNGDPISVSVEAVNANGTGERSDTVTRCVGAPGAPELTSCVTDETGVDLVWSEAAANSNRITGYTVYIADEAGTAAKFPTSGTSLRVDSTEGSENYYAFEAGKPYTVYVTCTNTAGEGAASNKERFTFGAAAAVKDVIADAGDGTLTVTWSKPDNEGLGEITGYNIYLNEDEEPTQTVTWNKLTGEAAEGEAPTVAYQLYVKDHRTNEDAYAYPSEGSTQGDLDKFTVIIDNLANGFAYTARVTAINEQGEGPEGGTVQPQTPKTQAGVPTDICAEALSGTEIELSWVKPMDNGGAAIKEYTVKPYKTAVRNNDTGEYEALAEREALAEITGIIGTSVKATGLVPGCEYEFEICAVTGSDGDYIEGNAGTSEKIKTHSMPGKPVILSVESEVGTMDYPKLTVTWMPSDDDGGSPLIGFDVYTETTRKMNMTNILGVDASNTSGDKVTKNDDGTYTYVISDSRIKNGTSYKINVVAYNAVTRSYDDSTSSWVYENGAWSETKTIRAGSIPAPKKVTLSSESSGSVTISWDMSQYSGILDYINGFMISESVDGGTYSQVVTDMNKVGKATVTQRPEDKTLSYTVAAIGRDGFAGIESEPVSILLGAPKAPTDVTATAGNTQARVSWTASATTGEYAAEHYDVYADGELKVSGVTETSTIVRGLTGGKTYKITVKAVNASGFASDASEVTEASTVTPWDKPDAPSVSDIKTGLSSFSFNMKYGDARGKTIEGYRVYVDNTELSSGVSDDGNGRVTVTGITNAEHTFCVTAVNVDGDESDLSAAYTIKTGVPMPPANVTAKAGSASAVIAWDASEDVSADHPTSEYEVFKIVSGVGESLGTTSETSFTASGLDNGKEYTFAVKALNDLGSSEYSEYVTAYAGAPGAPVITEIVPSSGSIKLSWSEPQKNAARITKYAVYVYTQNKNTGLWSGTRVLTTASREAELELENGVSYRLAVSAFNTYGEGAMSEFAETTPGGPPGAVTNVNIEKTYNSSDNCGLIITWSEPIDNGGQTITGYNVTGDGNISVDSALRRAVVTGLDKGVSYTYTITAASAAGVGTEYSTDAVTTLDVPGQPKIKGTSSSNNEITVLFAEPEDNGGTDVTDYIIEATLDDQTVTWKYSEHTDAPVEDGVITAVVSGEEGNELKESGWYTITVRAVNAVGEGAASDEQKVRVIGGVVETAPGKPTNVEATAGDGTITLMWSAPLSDGHSTINKYNIYYSTNREYLEQGSYTYSAETDGHTFTYTVKNLTNGETVYFAVQAVNAAAKNGGEWSEIVSATPLKVDAPSAPTWIGFDNAAGLSAYEMDARQNVMTLKWNASENSDDRGGDIHYEIYVNGRCMNEGETLTDTTYTIDFTDDTVASYSQISGTDLYNIIVRAVNAAGGSADSKYLYARKSLNIRKGSEEAGFVYDEYYADGIYSDIDSNYDGEVDHKISYSAPSEPRNVQIRQESNGTAILTWDTPESDGNSPIQGYYVTVSGKTEEIPVKAASSGEIVLMSNDIQLLSEEAEEITGGDTETGNTETGNNETGSSESDSAYSLEFEIEYGRAYTADVKAYNAYGTSSAANAILITTVEAPTNLRADLTDKKEITLTWNMANQDATSYNLYVNGDPVIVPAEKITWSEDNATATYAYSAEINNTYAFAVSAVFTGSSGSEKESSLSNTVKNISTYEEKANAPVLTLGEVDGESNLTISWTVPDNAEAADIDHYIIYTTDLTNNTNEISTNNESIVITEDTNAGTISTSIPVSNSCFIEVAAISVNGTLGEKSKAQTYYSSTSGDDPIATTAPNAPTDLKTAQILRTDGILQSGNNVKLTWTTGVSDDTHNAAVSFNVKVYNSGVLVKEDAVPAADGQDANSFEFEAEAGKTYTVSVTPYDSEDQNGSAASIKVDIPANEYAAPAVPELTAKLTEDGKHIELTWAQDTADTSVKYYLTVNGTADETTAYNSGYKYPVTDGTTRYFFVLKAVKTYSDGGTSSAQSDMVVVDTTGNSDFMSNKPPITGTLSNGTNEVKIYWKAPEKRTGETYDISYYRIVELLSDGKTAELGTLQITDDTVTTADGEYIFAIPFSAVNEKKKVEIQVYKEIDGYYLQTSVSDTWTATPNCNIAVDDMKYANDDRTGLKNIDRNGDGIPDEEQKTVKIPVTLFNLNRADGITVEFVQFENPLQTPALSTDENGGYFAEIALDKFNQSEDAGITIVISKPGHTKYTVTGVPYSALSNGINIDDVELYQGDLNGDGSVNTSDIQILNRYMNKFTADLSETVIFYDLNDDGIINTSDSQKINLNMNKGSVEKGFSK